MVQWLVTTLQQEFLSFVTKHIVIKNVTIEAVKGDAIKIVGSASLQSLVIQDNRIEFWDIDLDATEGGRAIDIQFNNDALFNASIIGNKFTAPAYGSEEPKDKEIILLSNVQKIGNVEFVGNTFSYTHPLHHPLSIDIDGDGTAEEYGYVSRDAGATYTLEVIKDLAAAEFNTGVIVAGYLPDGDASVYNEWVALPGDSNQYTPLTWAAYQTFVDNQGIDAESTGKEIYDATLALPVEQAKLIKKISSAHDDASLAPLLADPGVEQINLAAGNYTIVVAPAGPVIISGPNAGLAGTDAGRAAEAVLQGGVQSSHALTLDGVKVIDNGIYAKGTGNVAIQCTVIDDISVPSTDPLSGGDTIAIAFWNTGAANVDQVKITNVISTDPDSEGMGIKVNQGVTSLVVLNSHIETTDHNSINVHVSGTLTKLDILGNYLADWDCDEDDEGGRAIRIEYAGANGFVSNFIGNQIIARDFTGIPVDKEFIKLTNIKQLASVAFVNNTITDLDPTDGQWILSSGAEPIAIQDYGYVAKGAGAFELVKIKELTAADFAGAEVRLVGYLPDGDLSVFTPLAEEVYPLSQYTQSTADAYEAFVNGIDAESTGEEIYAATLALPTEQAKLIKKISPAANDAELVVLLANPEVEGVILAEGQTYNTAIDVDRKFAVYGPNQGTSGLSTERKPEALLLGGIGTYGGGLVVDGVKLETYGIYAKLQGVGDVEIRNTIINDVTTAHADEHYATISGIYLRNQGRVTIDAVKITNINHHRANNGITLGSYNPGAATDIVIQNCHIENVSHNSITVSTSTSISKIEIINNKLINWNSDMDADVGDSKEGGRALRLSVQSTLQPPFVLKVQGNTMTAPDYEAAGAHITDEEFIKINGTAKLTSVLFENNTISEPVAGLYILGLAPEAGPNKAYAYLKNPDDSYSFVRTDAFDELDFLGALEFVGYLPDAELAVYNAVLGQVNELDYTPASWAAYQIVVNANEVDATNNGKEIFDATHAIALAQEDLVLKVSSAADDAELAALLADPEVEEVILAGGVEYSAPIAPPAGNNTNISGPNKGKAYNDPDRVEEAVMSGGIITTGAGDLTIDGVKIEGSGVHAKGTGNVTIQNTIIDGVDNAHSTGEAIGIETWSAGTVLIDGVKITNISDTGSEFGMGIRIREGATDVIIRNSYIDGVTHNAINVYSCNSLTSLLIDNNTIKNWDSDMDTTEGGRAIRVSLTNAGAIPIIISNNVFEAPLYDAAFIPVDKEYIKITNITRASEVTLENNVMSAPIAAQWILSLGIGNTAPDANNTLSINGGAPASVDTKTLAESDFLDKLVFTP
jgi:hypothetical protein